jgi:hypothetical protein
LPLAGRHRVGRGWLRPKWFEKKRRALPVPAGEGAFLDSRHPGFVTQVSTPLQAPVDSLMGSSTRAESGSR